MKVANLKSFQAAPLRAQRARARGILCINAQQSLPVLVKGDGTRYTIDKSAVILGSSPSADIQLQENGVAAEHAKVEFKSGRLFCTALFAADPDNMLSRTATWVEGIELRPGVSYLVGEKSTLAFGTVDNTLIAEFQESGSAGGMADMLMKGMASQASKEVQEKLQDLS